MMNRRFWNIVSLLSLLGIPTVFSQLTVPSQGKVHGTSCEEGWLGFRGYCYIASESNADGKTYWKARNVCRSYGGALVSIHSEEEQEFVSTLLKSEEETWIGLLTKGTQRRNFKWDDETTVTYINPSVTGSNILSVSTVNDSCFFISTKQPAEWIFGDCEQRRLFICKKLVGLIPGDFKSLRLMRKNKSRRRRSNRFGQNLHANSGQISHRDEITPSLPWRTPPDILHHQNPWNMDEDHSNVLHPWMPESSPSSQSHLPKVSFFPLGNHGRFSSPFQSKFSNTFLQPDELARHHQENQEFHQNTNKVHFHTPSLFSDTSRHRLGSYVNEMAIQTSKQLSGDSNPYFPSLQASSGPISTATTSSIDSMESVSKSPPQEITSVTRCRENDFSFSGSCYSMPNPDDRMSYNEAYSTCKEKEAYLAVINSIDEQLFLSKLMSNVSILTWIGLRQTQNASSANILQWVDGTILDHSFRKFIVKDQLNGSCVAVSSNLTEAQSWFLKECDENNFSYICE